MGDLFGSWVMEPPKRKRARNQTTTLSCCLFLFSSSSLFFPTGQCWSFVDEWRMDKEHSNRWVWSRCGVRALLSSPVLLNDCLLHCPGLWFTSFRTQNFLPWPQQPPKDKFWVCSGLGFQSIFQICYIPVWNVFMKPSVMHNDDYIPLKK